MGLNLFSFKVLCDKLLLFPWHKRANKKCNINNIYMYNNVTMYKQCQIKSEQLAEYYILAHVVDTQQHLELYFSPLEPS